MSITDIRFYTYNIDAADYRKRFHRPDVFIESCRKCGNFGKSWACPPLIFDVDNVLGRYKRARIVVAKVAVAPGTPLADAHAVILPARRALEKYMLDIETLSGGAAFTLSGQCPHCTETCARSEGRPCRHPDLVRPSLEALGFDLAATTEQLFDMPMLWGENGAMPPYITLVAGLFHNSDAQLPEPQL